MSYLLLVGVHHIHCKHSNNMWNITYTSKSKEKKLIIMVKK